MKRAWVSGALAVMLVLGLTACDPAGGGDTTAYPLYVTNYGTDGSDGLSAYSIGAEGALAAIDTYSTGDSPFGIAVSPDGRYLFKTTVSGGTDGLAVYGIGAGGVLTALGTYDVGISPKGSAVSPDSRYLYVTNSSYDGTVGTYGISAYSIGAGGALTAITSGTLTTGAMPMGIAISPNGSYLYVAYSGNPGTTGGLSAFTIAADGSLASIDLGALTTGSRPLGIAISPDGSYLYVTNSGSTDGANGLSAYSIETGGTLAAIANYSTGTYPMYIAISPDGYLYVVYFGYYSGGTNGLSAYSIGAEGALAANETYPYSNEIEPQGIASSPDGSSLYVIHNTQTGADGLLAYSIGADGALTAIASGTTTTGRNPRGIAICPVKK